MTTAKVFENGRSQAVRLPKEYRFSENEIYIHKVGEIVMLIPKKMKWSGFLQGLDMFTEDFMTDGRDIEEEQEREEI